MLFRSVVLADAGTNTVLFRWHLGTEEAVQISGTGKEYTVAFPNTDIQITADCPVFVTQRFSPDNTLAGHISEDTPQNNHACLVVQSAEPVKRISLSTRVTAK